MIASSAGALFVVGATGTTDVGVTLVVGVLLSTIPVFVVHDSTVVLVVVPVDEFG